MERALLQCDAQPRQRCQLHIDAWGSRLEMRSHGRGEAAGAHGLRQHSADATCLARHCSERIASACSSSGCRPCFK
jgi:hypothetical protein